MKVNVYKRLKLGKYIVAGLVLKVTSPKGIRQFREQTQQYHYNLHTDLKQIYRESVATELEDGLYWIVAVVRTKDLGLHWNHYIIKIENDEMEVLEEYINQLSSDWIPQAMPTIKRYFKENSD